MTEVTAPPTIVDFLEKRLKEDLIGAAITPPHPEWHDRMNHGEHLVRIITVLRAIVAEHSEGDPRRPQRYCIVCASGDGNGEVWPCEEVRLIASLYNDHPDFQPEWAVGAAQERQELRSQANSGVPI